MRLFIFLCGLLVAAGTHAQPAGVYAMDDAGFSAYYAQRKVPVVTGKILNIPPAEIANTPLQFSVVTLFGQVKKTAVLQPDGSFTLELDNALPYQQIWFTAGQLFYAGLLANTDLFIELDYAKIKASGKELFCNGEGVRYLGTDGPLCSYAMNFILFRREEQQRIYQRLHLIPRQAKPTLAVSMATIGSMFDSLKLILDDYIARNPSPHAWLLQNELQSEYLGMMALQYWGHEMEDELLDILRKHRTFAVTNSSHDYLSYFSIYLNTLPANRVAASWANVAERSDLEPIEKSAVDSLRAAEKAGGQPPYTPENIQKWNRQLQTRIQAYRQEKTMELGIKTAEKYFDQPKADFMKLLINYSKDINDQKVAFESILPGMRTNWTRSFAEREYGNTLAKVAAVNKVMADAVSNSVISAFGAPLQQTAFGATLYTVANMKASDFLAKLRKTFPGKAIVLDLWATWCMPCIGEMPHSRELQASTNKLPVEFVYVCTSNNSSENKWKNKIGELKLAGTHFFIDEALDAEISQYFGFSGYPGYAFIDRKGVFRPGAIKRISQVDKDGLAALVQ